MTISPYAGQPARPAMLVNIPRLITAYFANQPDAAVASQRVSFGTSGHRGSSFDSSFNEWHVLAIAQAICDYRASQNVTGPLFLGIDTHALSEAAFASSLEVLAANNVTVMIDQNQDYTPTPVISHAILTYNRGRSAGLADGIVVTPSHNPPSDGGYKYNPPNGGPAETDATGWIQKQANQYLKRKLAGVKRVAYEQALKASTTQRYDYMNPYADDLKNCIDLDLIRSSGIHLGVDPLGGAGVHYWGLIRDKYHLDLTIVNEDVDPTFRFMSVDWDGKIRMDPSSSYAMQRLIGLKDKFDVAFACDTDHDRHGIVAKSVGLLPSNHYLAVMAYYLFQNRPNWRADSGLGKTIVSSSIIDRVAAGQRRKLYEVPVGFKYFVEGLLGSWLGFVGEESAGATFLRRDGTPWTTDKDGLVPALLSAEMTARLHKDPGQIYAEITAKYGDPVFERIDAPASHEQKVILAKLSPTDVHATELAGEKITQMLTTAPGDGKPIGGLKVGTENGWFAARPSGTEDVYKIYAESFKGQDHLKRIQAEAQEIVGATFAQAAKS
ncbi:MAG TPA: phosphoglucomutase (alpha-D-glucose-1,6-bisphosphate-dependent) [Aggregatilineales bacterium]|nr:phosphoglucomutase (alpha-D-glucose-1,6-bisphosphate-dependent) [Aggregatilineales bacterium]